MTVATLAVIGAGQMGAGIAQTAAQAGIKVFLFDAAPGKTASGIAGIAASLQKAVDKGKITAEARSSALALLHEAPSWLDLAHVDLLIEAATENAAIKVKILAEAAAVLRHEALIATNTSSISITQLAQSVTHPERFLGLHFMNPVPVMPLIELIYGQHTDAATQQKAEAFCKVLGKTAVKSADSPGFIVNRVLLPMINEAIGLLAEGVASAADIDAALKLGANQPMGPLSLADLIGLDTCLAILRVLQEGLGEKYRPHPLLVRYVAAGLLGRKSGRGFFNYQAPA